jgi:hypothetical protein
VLTEVVLDLELIVTCEACFSFRVLVSLANFPLNVLFNILLEAESLFTGGARLLQGRNVFLESICV